MTVPNPVEIFEYDPDWPVQFQRIRRAVTRALADVALSIEHVGSTSVPGLAAKPILDIDVVVRTTADVTNAIELLANIGYTHGAILEYQAEKRLRHPTMHINSISICWHQAPNHSKNTSHYEIA